jgi:hypothetical protein
MGIESKNNQIVPSRGTLGFQDSAEVYNCIHMEGWDEPPYLVHESKSCLTPSNRSLIWPKCPMKGSSSCSGQVATMFPVRQVRLVLHLPGSNPLASFMDKSVTISYLACQPHPWHVVCTGGYSRIPIHGSYSSTSYDVWDPISQRPTPRMSNISKLSSVPCSVPYPYLD